MNKNFIEEKRLEDFKRPNHPDFMDSSELKKEKWSGIRNNSLTEDLECWIEGEVVVVSSKLARSINPNDFEQKYAEYFGFHKTEIERN